MHMQQNRRLPYWMFYIQVIQRAKECKQLFQLIKNINSENIPYNVFDDVPSSRQDDFRLNDLVNLIDVDDISVMGHSFGAATSLLTLGQNKQIRYYIITQFCSLK